MTHAEFPGRVHLIQICIIILLYIYLLLFLDINHAGRLARLIARNHIISFWIMQLHMEFNKSIKEDVGLCLQ